MRDLLNGLRNVHLVRLSENTIWRYINTQILVLPCPVLHVSHSLVMLKLPHSTIDHSGWLIEFQLSIWLRNYVLNISWHIMDPIIHITWKGMFDVWLGLVVVIVVVVDTWLVQLLGWDEGRPGTIHSIITNFMLVNCVVQLWLLVLFLKQRVLLEQSLLDLGLLLELSTWLL